MAGSIFSGLLNRRKSLSALAAMADSKRSQGAGSCNVSLEDTYYEIKKETILEKFKHLFTRQKSIMNSLYVIFKFTVYSGSGNSHKVIVRMLYDPQGVLGPGQNITQIYCDCADFIYRSTYILNQSGSLFRSQDSDLKLGVAIGTAPKKTNTSAGSICKHCVAVVNYIMSNYSYLMG